MRRFDIAELHERSWFPRSLRDLTTDGLQFVLNASRFYRPVAEPLVRAVRTAGADRVIDLCSGGAGPWLWLHSRFCTHASKPVEIVLTDKYPNVAAFQHARSISGGVISYSVEPVDAARIPPQLCGFRTIFSSFHHLSPGEIVGMLQNAADQRQGFGAFEGARRSISTMLGLVLVPIGALLSAPFVRPFRVSRLFWTYVLPLIPLVLFVDGVLSCLRAYKPAEMLALCEKVSAPGYVWAAGEAPGWFGRVTYLLGYPTAEAKPNLCS